MLSKNWGVTGFAMLAAMMMFHPAEAKVRNCDADVVVELKARAGHPAATRIIERYSASGSCASANCARRRAKTNALGCMVKVWEDRWDGAPGPHGIPPQCEFSHKVRNFGMRHVKCEIYDAICSMRDLQDRPNNVRDSAIIWTRVSGQTNSCTEAYKHSGDYGLSECSPTARENVCGDYPSTLSLPDPG